MRVRRVVPNIHADDLAATRDFYVDALGFQVVMDLGWIVTVSAPDDPQRQISIISEDATAPAHPDISIEVDDVDAAHEQAVQEGREIVHPLTDEAWGVRRFFCRDPSGTVVNILSHR
ncbi:VOC family protein [Saccharopolyspora sp. NPDC050389]|uniref:VOC family protein n=1 Tax=Saccharopolyspora sp. NPDC050389 TaxID=3155516 RepID=UPI00340E632E